MLFMCIPSVLLVRLSLSYRECPRNGFIDDFERGGGWGKGRGRGGGGGGVGVKRGVLAGVGVGGGGGVITKSVSFKSRLAFI